MVKKKNVKPSFVVPTKWNDKGQQIMPGHTRHQTRDATQLVEENLDDFYQDCALMSAIVTGQNDEPKTFQEAWYYK